MEDGNIFANALSGVEIMESGNLTIRQSRINCNENWAIQLHTNGKGTVENCDLIGNKRGAFDIGSGSQIQRSNNKT
ncbi:right-handed parallel beta-helix repeat-containing protein [Tumidithrix helvetica]|uniref:right-handed parallel beta-helix repeat-containing protein n=1 Tax=Tumidithrix helvetica TaxID=3457545 RepID=UPI003CC612C0